MDPPERIGNERKPRNRGHDEVPEGTLRRVSQFELEQFERSGDRLRVAGRWSDVRGMRFMRPTLTVGDRRVLAVLDHKPWAPEEGQRWIAEFPWDGDVADIDPTLAELAVAPSVAVALSSPGVPVEPLVEAKPKPDPAAVDEERRHRQESEITFLREQIDLLKGRLAETERERDEALAAQTDGPPPPPDDDRVDKLRAELDNARERLGDERERRAKAEADYDHARIGRDAAEHELAHVREELAAREVQLPDEPASGTVAVPAPPPEPVHRDEPAPFVKTLEVWIPRFLVAVFALCVLLLLIGAVKVV
jgi:hypothetical protein